MPHQILVPTVMLELVSESVLTGDEKGEDSITLTSEIQLEGPARSWIPSDLRPGKRFCGLFSIRESFRLGP